MDATANTLVGQPADAELSHERILQTPLTWLRPSPENEKLYRPISSRDPDVAALADSLAENGVQEPLLATKDGWIVSGHRRLAAAGVAGLETVPVRFLPWRKDDNPDEFMRLLVECNRQRVKSFDEVVREEVVSATPEDAYQALVACRQQSAKIDCHKRIKIRGKKHRAEISKAKLPLLTAIRSVIEASADFLPLTDRRIHYMLLNNPPLIHASKRGSGYRNDATS